MTVRGEVPSRGSQAPPTGHLTPVILQVFRRVVAVRVSQLVAGQGWRVPAVTQGEKKSRLN